MADFREGLVVEFYDSNHAALGQPWLAFELLFVCCFYKHCQAITQQQWLALSLLCAFGSAAEGSSSPASVMTAEKGATWM